MPPGTLTRRSYYVNPRAVRRAQRVLRTRTEAEAVREAIDRVAELEEFWRFMTSTRATLRRGGIRR